MESQSQISQFYIPPGFIDLGLGDPQFSLLPLDLIRQAAQERLSLADPEFLQYGSKQGDGTFRKSLSEFLSRGYDQPVDPDNLFITSGASMGLHLICTLFTQPGDTIFVEEPTYFFALRIFADHHLHLVPIQTDQDGLKIESLEEELVKFQPKFLYIIPTFQNPTGHTLSADRRNQLVKISRQQKLLVVADEVYHFLDFSGHPPIPFAAYAESGNIISLGSFSKILAPGLRLGWMQANPELIQVLINCGLLESGGGMNPFTSAIVSRMVQDGGLQANLDKLITTYRFRLATMDAALRRYLPGCDYSLPQGGYFFWVHLPDGKDASDLQCLAKEFMVGFRPGALFSCQNGMKDYLRLSYVFYEPEDLEEGILRLKNSLQKLE
jgi:2-aminoadipate transaminase